MKKERLDKILSSQNLGSRRETGELIRAGRVSVNGTPVRKPGFQADPQTDQILLDGSPVEVKKNLTLMMNKPAGVLSASRDTRAQTVVDLLPQNWRRRGMFPAGRLDRDTTGLLILTDDGAMAHRMLAPKSHVQKWYEAVLASPVTEQDREAFRNGIVLSGGEACLPADLQVLCEGPEPLVQVKICEGKFHQIKRMFLARENCVKELRRVRIGGLCLDPLLAPGEARELTKSELDAIFVK